MDRPSVDEESVVYENHAPRYAARVVQGNQAVVMHGQLLEDYKLLQQGRALYLKSFCCGEKDMDIVKRLMAELEASASDPDNKDKGFIQWSKHFKLENPDKLPTFKEVVARMARYFDVEVYATRLNFYADNTSWKPFHHDSHAGRAFFEHGGVGPREDFTMGASFGDERELAFLHVQSQALFSFPQRNGDVFAFDATVNQQFQHGVPKTTGKVGPRFSIIAWGRRVKLTVRNGAPPGEVGTRDEVGQLKFPPGYESFLGSGYKEKGTKENRVNEAGPAIAAVKESVDALVVKVEKKDQQGKNGKKRNGRIQVKK